MREQSTDGKIKSCSRVGCWTKSSVIFLILLLVSVTQTDYIHAETYRIKPGDTLSQISEKIGISSGVLQTLNPDILSADILFTDQEIFIPDNSLPLEPHPIHSTFDETTHTIQSGETLSELAEKYGISLSDLKNRNPGIDPNWLIIGTAITIRGEVNEQNPDLSQEDTFLNRSNAILYVVKTGDTFSFLAKRFSTTQEILFSLNPSVSPNLLIAGTSIIIPQSPALESPLGDVSEGSEALLYTVISGDTATDIAMRHGLTLQQLRDANPNSDLDLIWNGQVIGIPKFTENSTPLSNVSNQNPTPSDLIKYVIKPGDNASTIATRHGISLTTLRALNSLVNLDILQIGELIVVPIIDLPPPSPGSVPAGPPPLIKYTVASGDSFTEIANSFGIDTMELISVNPNIDIDTLTIDQMLLIPKPVPIPIVSRTEINQITAGIEIVAADLGILPHTLIANNSEISTTGLIFSGTELRIPNNEGIIIKVRDGDTLAAIAAIFGSSIEAISSEPRNGVLDSNGLIAGQEIILPIKVPDFIWPVNGLITDGFGVCRSWDCSIRHKGIDIDQFHTPGAPVISMAPGEIIFSGGNPCCGLGFYVEIDHGNGWSSSYGHLNGLPIVSEGQFVEQGQTLGYSGTTGFSTGYHLHLEMKHNGFFLDGTNYLP